MISVKDYFDSANNLPVVTIDNLIGAGGLIVVAPHPDDETLGCGGVLALCAKAGRACQIIVVSDGTGSHPNSKRWPSVKLKALREQETCDAIGALGLSSAAVKFLDARDRFIPSDGYQAERLAAMIAEAAQDINASAIAVTWRYDPHCDHTACWQLTRKARSKLKIKPRLLSYPVWGHTLQDAVFQEPPTGSRLFIGDVLAQKQQALSCHKSQISALISDDPKGFTLSHDMVSRARLPYELFFTEEHLM